MLWWRMWRRWKRRIEWLGGYDGLLVRRVRRRREKYATNCVLIRKGLHVDFSFIDGDRGIPRYVAG